LSDNLVEASGLSETSFEPLLSEEQLLIESIDDEDEYNSSREGSENYDSDDDSEDEDQLLNSVGKLKQEKHFNIPNTYSSVSPVTPSARRRLYPPGRIMHMIPSHMSENSNSNHSEAVERHICLLYASLLKNISAYYIKRLQSLMENSDFQEDDTRWKKTYIST